MRRVLLALILLGGLLVSGSLIGSTEPATATTEHAATEEHSGHQSPVTPVLLGIVIILLAAKIGGEIAERVQQPAVLGELIAGVVRVVLPEPLRMEA